MRYIIEFISKVTGETIKTSPFSKYSSAYNFLDMMEIMEGYEGRIVPEMECEKENITCKHWIELDDENNISQEVCRSANLQCTCSGEKENCDYPLHFEKKMEVKNA